MTRSIQSCPLLRGRGRRRRERCSRCRTRRPAPRPASTDRARRSPGIELNQWTGDVTHAPYNLSVNYQSSSSGSGRQDFKDKVVDFAVTDIRYNEYDGVPPDPSTFHYVPVTAGGIAFMYNLKAHGFSASSKAINLSPRTVCGIFTGAVPYWDDAEHQGRQPGCEAAARRGARRSSAATRPARTS